MNVKIDPIAPSTKKSSSSIIASLAVEQQPRELPPAGYMPIELSTKGKLLAPAKFHIRNFNTGEILTLSLTEDRDLPMRVVELLNEMIFEEGVDVAQFHEREVVETMVKLYASFYSPVFRDVAFPIAEEDLQHIRDNNSKAEADRLIEMLVSGKWKPTTDIDIIKNVHTYELDSNFKSTATITNKKTGFTLTFRTPLYGDILLVRAWLKEFFDDDDRELSPIRQKLEIREKMLEAYRRGDIADLTKVPYVSDAEEQRYQAYAREQAAVAIEVIRALHLVAFDGEDVSDKPISDKMQLTMDPRVDARVTKKLDAYFEGLQFGIKEEVDMINPITGELCSRRFSFRPAFIIQATQLPESDDYEFVFDE
jgi:hypothetical protein